MLQHADLWSKPKYSSTKKGFSQDRNNEIISPTKQNNLKFLFKKVPDKDDHCFHLSDTKCIMKVTQPCYPRPLDRFSVHLFFAMTMEFCLIHFPTLWYYDNNSHLQSSFFSMTYDMCSCTCKEPFNLCSLKDFWLFFLGMYTCSITAINTISRHLCQNRGYIRFYIFNFTKS